jgi:hypothetical protein
MGFPDSYVGENGLVHVKTSRLPKREFGMSMQIGITELDMSLFHAVLIKIHGRFAFLANYLGAHAFRIHQSPIKRAFVRVAKVARYFTHQEISVGDRIVLDRITRFLRSRLAKMAIALEMMEAFSIRE